LGTSSKKKRKSWVPGRSGLAQYTPAWWELQLQRGLGWLFFLVFGNFLVLLMRTVRGYRISNMEQVRKQFRALCESNQPLLICSNHLTFIDSALIIWALASNTWYFKNFSKMSWNLPAGDFFKKRWYFRVVAYLTKCIFIHRDGPKKHHDEILGYVRRHLVDGEVVTIFPEGKRSRSGFVHPGHITFGTGKVVSNTPGCRVLCMYVRGVGQQSYAGYPAKGSEIYVSLKCIEPKTEMLGRDAYRDLTYQIVQNIMDLEKAYFELHDPQMLSKLPQEASLQGSSKAVAARRHPQESAFLDS
jgi:1-acyl-sn-glycerol-3-phosphate acyltransferase